jgi:site-specific DNA-methyltransferase (adenine-specific)
MNPETGLPSFPDNHFDLAIVDPPYGIGEDGRHSVGRVQRRDGTVIQKIGERNGRKFEVYAKTYSGGRYDDCSPPLDYFLELQRVSKNQIVWGANHFISKIAIDSPCWIVWDKVNGGTDFADCELALTSFKTAVRKFSFMWSGFKQAKAVASGTVMQGNMAEREERIHPNHKPQALYRWLVKNYAKQGDKILDTHVGSASSLVVYEEMGFEYVGFELDPDYYRESCKRLEAFRAQPKLFTGKEIFEASKQLSLI